MIEAFDSVDALPADAAALLAQAERTEFQLGAAWFATVAAHALPAGARPRLLLYREAGQAIALLPEHRFQLTWSSFVPRASAWERSYFALHEWIGCAWYALKAR